MTFTSAIAVDNLFELAPDEDALTTAMLGPARAIAVGPVTADALRRHGVRRVIEPDRARLGAMVQALVATMSGLRRVITYRSATAIWQGSALVVGDDAPTLLTSGEARLLEVLLDRAPAVVPKAVLVERGTDVHAAEVAVARLRTKLGPLGAGICTVPRRGYRCELTVRGAGARAGFSVSEAPHLAGTRRQNPIGKVVGSVCEAARAEEEQVDDDASRTPGGHADPRCAGARRRRLGGGPGRSCSMSSTRRPSR